MPIAADSSSSLSGPLVVALVYDGLCTFEFGIAAEIFGLDRPEMGPGWYRFASVAIEAGPMRAHGGLRVVADGGSELLEHADIIIVPGWRGAEAPVPIALAEQLVAAHRRGCRLVSICSGAFVLAATGLLDGRRVTTHWRYAEELRRRFPALLVDEAALYHGEDRIFTSAGSAAGIDLMIALVRHDFGAEAANSVARRIVMPAHRNGGQAQFLERPVAWRRENALGPLLDEVRASLARRWTIAAMAKMVNMSRRTFERRFVETTGLGPGEWLAAERVEAAKDMLTSSTASMDEVAAAVGFGTAHAMRHHFRARVRLSPTAYRQEFLPV
ncbi:transcriptional regulator FtrA [Erythrobacter donghaensis]|jgi:AraC family transcriptional activator FtrA|uniref:transcriptional regulator FtrA n=1 Tax=Erythrobacter donghaensis TaxID=267135 RepID=UPI00093C40A3|nr:transcriptional regulator FtrA [Erythrobacter donghaensis]